MEAIRVMPRGGRQPEKWLAPETISVKGLKELKNVALNASQTTSRRVDAVLLAISILADSVRAEQQIRYKYVTSRASALTSTSTLTKFWKAVRKSEQPSEPGERPQPTAPSKFNCKPAMLGSSLKKKKKKMTYDSHPSTRSLIHSCGQGVKT